MCRLIWVRAAPLIKEDTFLLSMAYIEEMRKISIFVFCPKMRLIWICETPHGKSPLVQPLAYAWFINAVLKPRGLSEIRRLEKKL